MLVIDSGNTRIKWARIEQAKLLHIGHAMLRDSTAEAFEALGKALVPGIQRVLVANVAGAEVAERIAAVVSSRLKIAPEFVTVEAAAHGISCAYAEPQSFGVDRWAAMIAGRSLVPGPVCVVSAGTAVTFDALDRDGRHLGGLILPGQRLMHTALEMQTEQIGATPPASDVTRGLNILGTTTEESVGHGSRLAIAAALDRAVGIVTDALGEPPRVLLSGGDAGSLVGWLESEAQVRADLVLEGLAVIANDTE